MHLLKKSLLNHCVPFTYTYSQLIYVKLNNPDLVIALLLHIYLEPYDVVYTSFDLPFLCLGFLSV